MNTGGESFAYDSYGRRVSKTILGTTTSFLYDGANPVQGLSGTTPTANLLTGGIDEYFTRTDSTGTANYLTDALGSTVALTNSSGGTIASYTYEPFGNTTATGSSMNTYEYTGRENDGTGVFYYRERYYNPSLVRFLSEDPIEFAGRLNLYAYVEENPLSRIDPLGLCWIYVQRTGDIFYDQYNSGLLFWAGTGYSGSGPGLNNPGYQDVNNVGPLPQGTYTIGAQQDNTTQTGHILYQSMRLVPDPNNEMFGRDGFLMHGDNQKKNHTASKGCIVLPPDVRHRIADSKDHCLEVVP